MDKIKIYFSDFWPHFDPVKSPFYRILSKSYDISISKDNPDILFYSTEGQGYLSFRCLRVFYTREQVCPDFDLADYSLGYERITFGNRYIRFPYYLYYLIENDYLDRFDEIRFSNQLKAKKPLASFVYSNSKATLDRKIIFNKLSNDFEIVSGGRFKNNLGYFVDNKLEFESEFQYSIALENAIYEDYISEKIIDSYLAGSIPIYIGSPNIEMDFKSNTFINLTERYLNEYSGLETKISLAKEIKLVNLLEDPFTVPLKIQLEEMEIFLLRIAREAYKGIIFRPDSQRSSWKAQKLKFSNRLKFLKKITPNLLKRFILKIM